jgi:hypothetical protein
MKPATKPIFSMGREVATPGALAAIEGAQEDPHSFLMRHESGDWGDVSQVDREENEFSLDKMLRIFSVYYLQDGTKIWIITEADRSSTTILLPEEY